MYLDYIDHKCLASWPVSCVFINDFIIPPADSSLGNKQVSGRTDGPFTVA